MEKKTIGKLITALRKANGMTQRDLAEKLNVSDKTVSRWERDEGTPDLSLIPVLAEIFGVSCDELLRGERTSPEKRTEDAEELLTTKGEKQKQRLLKKSMSQYRNFTFISCGISAIGMIAALIANLAFLKAVLGFLMGAIFFVASAVCQAVFMNRAFLSVEDAGLSEQELSSFKKNVIDLAEKSFGLTMGFVGFTFPLVMMDAYVGLRADNMFIFGMVGAAVFLSGYAVLLYFVNHSLLKNGVYTFAEKQFDVYQHNHKLQKLCVVSLVVVLGCTLFLHQLMTNLWGPHSIMTGITFTDYESFIAFMEQDIPHQPNDRFNGGTTGIEEVIEVPESTIYYDEDGNEISQEQFYHRTLEDLEGNVVCEYDARNESVVSIQYSPKKGTILPITVHTEEDLMAARETVSVRHVIFGVVYGIEVIAALLIYMKKRKTA